MGTDTRPYQYWIDSITNRSKSCTSHPSEKYPRSSEELATSPKSSQRDAISCRHWLAEDSRYSQYRFKASLQTFFASSNDGKRSSRDRTRTIYSLSTPT